MNAVANLFMRSLLGADGKLRPIWRAVIFYTGGSWAIFPLLNRPFGHIAHWLHIGTEFSAGAVALSEIQNFLTALICTAIFALYERRRVDSYGLPVARALGRQTFEGAAAGIALAGAVAAGMLLLGGMQIRGLAISGSALVISALAWLGTNVCVGIAEESFYRSYLQQTLWKSMGFWPSAIVIAFVFAADHYFYKTGENIWDVITLVSVRAHPRTSES